MFSPSQQILRDPLGMKERQHTVYFEVSIIHGQGTHQRQ